MLYCENSNCYRLVTAVCVIISVAASFRTYSTINTINLVFFFKQDKLLLKNSPIALPKSIKNPTEIEGMKKANVRTTFLHLFSLDKTYETTIFLNSLFLTSALCANADPIVHSKVDFSGS